MRSEVTLLLALVVLAGCGPNPDEDMWACQLSVQKGNAGKDAAAAAERARDIEACMADRGYRLDSHKAGCSDGSVDSSCYAAK